VPSRRAAAIRLVADIVIPSNPPEPFAMPLTAPASPDVVLLSAGPGDLDLLTLGAVKALAAAQVLLLDELVDPQIVALAPQARVIHVGKRGGCRSTPQQFICRLMRRYALQGLRVVRVKGGEALLFGRAGEEIAFLRRAGVGVRIINGVSSAFAAAAALNVSLTHRDHCHGVTFVTAHTHDGGEPDWASLAAVGTTLAIYMGVRRIGAIARSLQAVLPGDTPAALVCDASRGSQRVHLTTLAGLQDLWGQQDDGAPGVILVGRALAEAQVAHPRAATLIEKIAI